MTYEKDLESLEKVMKSGGNVKVEKEGEKIVVMKSFWIGFGDAIESCGCIVIIILALFGGAVVELIKYVVDKLAN